MDRFPVIKSQGPLVHYAQNRSRILNAVVENAFNEIADRDLEYAIREALFMERQRLQKMGRLGFTSLAAKKRTRIDKKLWGEIRRTLVGETSVNQNQVLLRKILEHYAEEIGGRFNERIYRTIGQLVPWSLSWLLNVASAKNLVPWKAQASLFERLKITGHTEQLQSLEKRGTILLVPTHMSNIDSLIIGYVTAALGLPPFSYGAGLNLFSSPILGFFMGNLGAYTVDRQKHNGIYKEVLKSFSAQILTEGVHSTFFPGGGRARSGAVESHLKLGLLGTGLTAQIGNFQRGVNKKIFVVPMTTSYHFVLEASSLIDDYLAQVGKSRFIPVDEEEKWFMTKAVKFFWDVFSRQSEIVIRIGQPLDVFGNPVDENGDSLGVHGRVVDIRNWCVSQGELRAEGSRDRVYTKILGEKIVDRYFCENTVLSSQAVAFSLLKTLRRKHRHLDLFHLLRLPFEARQVSSQEFLRECESLHEKLQALYRDKKIELSEVMKGSDVVAWARDGVEKLGMFHSNTIARWENEVICLGDLNLLYFYRNRLSGYNLGLNAEDGYHIARGDCDRQGFLA